MSLFLYNSEKKFLVVSDLWNKYFVLFLDKLFSLFAFPSPGFPIHDLIFIFSYNFSVSIVY